MTKQCEELRALLSGYRDGELSAEDAHRVAGHLAECVECATALTSDAEIEKVVSESIVSRTSGEWDALTMSIQRALEKEANHRQRAVERPRAREAKRRRWRRFVLALTPKRLAFGGAGTIAIAALVFLLQPWRQELMPEVAVPTVVVPEAEPARQLRALGYLEGSSADAPAADEELDALASLEDQVEEPPSVTDARAVRDQGRDQPGALAKTRLSEAPAEKEGRREPVAEAKKAERADAKQPAAGRAGLAQALPPSEAGLADRDSPAGSTDFLAREAAPKPVPVEMTEPVKVSVASPPSDAPEQRLKTEGPSFEPAAPPGGARSVAEVQEWLDDVAGGGAPSRARAIEAAEAPAPGATTAERALTRANALISQGERGRGRAGLVLLTGDFAGNAARERAWTHLLSLDADTAFGTRRPAVILPIAQSMDAFLETYPEHENAESIREQQVRVWARLAENDPIYCAAALKRAEAWEASLGQWVPFETRMVVARMHKGPCSE